jgi:WXG100 family type VII secretion target
MAEEIRADYEALDEVASKFEQQSELVAELGQLLASRMEPLESGDWIGRGSDAFFNEMNGKIMPAVGRLINVLSDASAVAKEIVAKMKQAEEEAQSPFASYDISGI